MNFVYQETEKHTVWTVGHYGDGGKWVPESDHASKLLAGLRCSMLNGGSAEETCRDWERVALEWELLSTKADADLTALRTVCRLVRAALMQVVVSEDGLSGDDARLIVHKLDELILMQEGDPSNADKTHNTTSAGTLDNEQGDDTGGKADAESGTVGGEESEAPGPERNPQQDGGAGAGRDSGGA